MVKNTITIGHLYPKQMNVYGDMGNIITLRYRLESRGFAVKYVELDSLGSSDMGKIDLMVGGGGQDSNQTLIQNDIKRHAKILRARCTDGLPGLMVCGMYQLLGHRFLVADGSEITGAGVFDLETIASDKRLIGNVVVSSRWGQLVGFENHSGRTYLGAGTERLGEVLKGSGNNDEDKTEGAVVNNVFGTYMHGPVLAKNPQFADEIIKRTLVRRGITEQLQPLDDMLEIQAANQAAKRPR